MVWHVAGRYAGAVVRTVEYRGSTSPGGRDSQHQQIRRAGGRGGAGAARAARAAAALIEAIPCRRCSPGRSGCKKRDRWASPSPGRRALIYHGQRRRRRGDGQHQHVVMVCLPCRWHRRCVMPMIAARRVTSPLPWWRQPRGDTRRPTGADK